MSFTGDEGEMISLTEGAALTAAYRNQNSGTTLGHFFGKSKLEELLGQSGCKGLRIYYGRSSSGSPELVVVGVDQDENDILGNNALILDRSVGCPPTCGNSNDLNS